MAIPRYARHFLAAAFCTLLSGPPVYAGDPVIINDYALQLLHQGEYEKAIDQLRQAFSLFATNDVLRRNLATAYTLHGQHLLEKNSCSEAAERFRQAGELYPDDPQYAQLRGTALYLAKNYDSARYELERVRALGGENVDTLYLLGRISYDTGDTAGALEKWEKAAALNPADQSLQELLARARQETSVEGRMDQGHSSRFMVSYDQEVRSVGALAILDALEDAYNNVGADLSHFPTARIPVILYTQKDFRAVTRSPDWSGGVYDGKIRLPVGGVADVTPEMRAVLRHEYTHAVVFDLTHGNCPTWLNEGLAEVEGRKEHNPPLPHLGRAAKNGGFSDIRALEGSFAPLGAKEAGLAYEQSYALVNYMVTTYGWYNVREILVNLGSGMPIGPAIARALQGFGLDYDGVLREWREYMGREFGAGQR